MANGRRGLKAFFLVLAVLLLALFLWMVSPGPERLARATAESYAERYAPDYSYHLLMVEGNVDRLVGMFSVRYPSWTALLAQESDEYYQGPCLRLELNNGFFPVKVLEAKWWPPELMEWPEIPLPVSE